MCIITRLQQNDECAFKSLYDEWHQRLYAYVLGKTGSEYFAEEVVQITFIKLWKYRYSLQKELSFSCQLFRIAKTCLIDLLRKEASKKQYEEFTLHAAAQETVWQAIDYKETQSKIHRLVQLMPPLRREIFTLSRFACLTHKEIAEKLAISPKCVENHIYLALKYLKPFFLFSAMSLFLI